MILVSDNKSSIVSDPAESALDYISSLVAIPESVVLSIDIPVVFAMRRLKVDASFSQTLSSRIAVVRLVSDHTIGWVHRLSSGQTPANQSRHHHTLRMGLPGCKRLFTFMVAGVVDKCGSTPSEGWQG